MRMARGRRAKVAAPKPTRPRKPSTNGDISDYFRVVEDERDLRQSPDVQNDSKRAILNNIFKKENGTLSFERERNGECHLEVCIVDDELHPGPDCDRDRSPGSLRLSPRKHASTLQRCVSAKENIKTPHRIGICNGVDSELPTVRQLSFEPPKTQPKRKPSSKNSNLKLRETQNDTIETVVKQENGIHSLDEKCDDVKLLNNQIYAKPNKLQNGNHKLTEYFPIRRSVRKTKKEVLEQKRLDIEIAIKKQTEDGLEIACFEGKGRGIIASRKFERGEFVVEYAGELVDINEAKQREARYAQDLATGCYMYYFRHNDQHYCIDATSETGRLGRLVNHSRNGNLVTKSISIGARPHLILIANQDISPGEEITYDYGDRSKESLQHHPWLAL